MSDKPKKWTWEEWSENIYGSNGCAHCFSVNEPYIEWLEAENKKLKKENKELSKEIEDMVLEAKEEYPDD